MNTDGMTITQVEAKGVELAHELFAIWQKPGTMVLDTSTCRQVALAQRTFGDFLLTTKWTGDTVGIEVKTERRHTGNLFLESWSNLTKLAGYRRDGWLFTLQADVYVNIFLDMEVAYVMQLADLRRWAVEEGNAYGFPERPAGMSVAGQQKNMTLGFVVPVAAMLEAKNNSKPVRVLKYVRRAGAWGQQEAKAA